MILLILLLIIILCIIYLYSKNKNNNNIIFLESTELKKILINDTDNYYDRFYDYDWKARHVKNKEEYINNIKNKNICLSWTEEQKKIVNNAIDNINKKLNKIKLDKIRSNDIYNINLLEIPWIIGIVNNEYENGCPHTRHNIIIINDATIKNKNLIETLLHEKIHIFQKIYPHIINDIIKKINFKLKNKRKYNNLIRVNPDTDDNIYSYNNNIMMAQYNSYYPKSISDIKFNNTIQDQIYEHPLEWIAINVANRIVN